MTASHNDHEEPAADPAAGIVTDLFHNCALVAFVLEARAAGTWPESEAVRRRAYALYERELAKEHVDSCLQEVKNGPCSPEHDATTTGRNQR